MPKSGRADRNGKLRSEVGRQTKLRYCADVGVLCGLVDLLGLVDCWLGGLFGIVACWPGGLLAWWLVGLVACWPGCLLAWWLVGLYVCVCSAFLPLVGHKRYKTQACRQSIGVGAVELACPSWVRQNTNLKLAASQLVSVPLRK